MYTDCYYAMKIVVISRGFSLVACGCCSRSCRTYRYRMIHANKSIVAVVAFRLLYYAHFCLLTPTLDFPAVQERAGVLPRGRYGCGRHPGAQIHVSKVVTHASRAVSAVGVVA